VWQGSEILIQKGSRSLGDVANAGDLGVLDISIVLGEFAALSARPGITTESMSAMPSRAVQPKDMSWASHPR
jgi:hypothetical protein